MAILQRCCCWKSVRKGSFASGIYTLFFYSMLLCAGILYVRAPQDKNESPVVFILTLLLIIFSGFCIITSLAMLIGLCTENRILLLPWVFTVSIATIIVLVITFCLLPKSIDEYSSLIFCIVDYCLCSLNVYCILCVVSQYQMLGAGGRRSHTVGAFRGMPVAQYRNGSKELIQNDQSVSRNTGEGGTKSIHLVVPTPTTTSCSSPSRSRPSTDMSSVSEDPSGLVEPLRKISTDYTTTDDTSVSTAPLLKI